MNDEQYMKLAMEGRKVRYNVLKPFDTILNYADNKLLLENRNTNITTQLSHIIKAFSDFMLVAQTREEISLINTYQKNSTIAPESVILSCSCY